MKKYVRVVGSVVHDIVTLRDSDIVADCFHPDVASQLMPLVGECPTYSEETQEPRLVVGAETVTWAIEDRSLDDLKGVGINKVRIEANKVILYSCPTWKQLNRNVPGRMTSEEITDMDTFIDACRDVCNTAETSINTATTSAEVISAGVVTWPT